MAYYRYLLKLLTDKKSKKEILKWDLKESILRLKSEEMKRLKLLYNNLSSNDSHKKYFKGTLKNDNMKDNNDNINNNNKNNNNINNDNNDNINNDNDNINNNQIEISTKNSLAYTARQILYILTLTIFSANTILKLTNAFQNKKNFNSIFDDISILPLTKKFFFFFNENLFIGKMFDFFGSFITQFLNFLQKSISDFGFDNVTSIPSFPIFSHFSFSSILSSLQSLNSKYSNISSNNKSSILNLLHADLTIQLQQIIFFIIIIIGPFLLFYQFLPLISTSVESVQNILFMEDILQDSSFDSFFSSQNYHNIDENKYVNDNVNVNSSVYENKIFSDSDDTGWTIDGPDKGSGVIFRNLTVERGGITVLNVRTSTLRSYKQCFLFYCLFLLQILR